MSIDVYQCGAVIVSDQAFQGLTAIF